MRKPVPQSVVARRGFLSLELALTLPIVMIVVFALFQFSLLFTARSVVSEAARSGCRKATYPSMQHEEVERTVRAKLTPRLRNSAEISIERGQHTGDVVRVSIRVPMRAASPDLLWPIGYSLKDRTIAAEARMTRE